MIVLSEEFQENPADGQTLIHNHDFTFSPLAIMVCYRSLFDIALRPDVS
jgi:hypothetical protein